MPPNGIGRAIIEPRKGRREKLLPNASLLVFTPQDLALLNGFFSEKPTRTHKILLSDVVVGSWNGVSIAIAGPVIGAPQAVMVCEKMIALGVRTIIALGWCGSLSPGVRIGDIVLPAWAVSGEGTSSHYPVDGRPGPSDDIIGAFRRILDSQRQDVHVGAVWSTDAPYRETEEKVRELQREGVLAVDMETSALFTLAVFRGISLTVALVVSDDLSSLEWKHGFKNPRFNEGREALVMAALEIAASASVGVVPPGNGPV